MSERTTTEVAQPLAGRLVDDGHELRVRIYYEDTDFSGLVYHANHLKYYERGRSDYLRLIGVHHHELDALDPPLAFAVTQINVTYKVPARIDDIICVHTRVASVKGVQFFIAQSLTRDGQTLSEARVDVVCIDKTGRPRRLPKALAERLAAVTNLSASAQKEA